MFVLLTILVLLILFGMVSSVKVSVALMENLLHGLVWSSLSEIASSADIIYYVYVTLCGWYSLLPYGMCMHGMTVTAAVTVDVIN